MLINNHNINLQDYSEYSVIRNQVNEKSEFKDDLIQYFEQRKHGILGDKLPWKSTHQKLAFRKKEVTVFAGSNGSGKSLILGQIALEFVDNGSKVLVASLEMPPVTTLARMTRQAIGQNFPSDTQIEQFMKWQLDKFYLYNHVGNLDQWQVIALCRYAALELGCSHIVIDSLMKCTKGETDYDGQKDFINALCEVAKEVDIHILLVHHVRKSADENHEAGKFDLKGSGSISDLADNVLIINRNRKKERETYNNKGMADNTVPDAVVVVSKVRNGDWEGIIPLFFEKHSQQYTEIAHEPIKRYL
jgi:twinkle protein